MPATDYQIARALDADVAAIAPLFDAYRQFYHRPADLAGAHRFLAQRIANNDSVVLFCHARSDRSQAAGFTQLYPIFSSLSLAPSWVLNDLFVAPAFRQHGIARLLLSAADEHARGSGAIGIGLETQHTNHAAQALYKSFGYEEADDTKHYWRTIEPNASIG